MRAAEIINQLSFRENHTSVYKGEREVMKYKNTYMSNGYNSSQSFLPNLAYDPTLMVGGDIDHL